MAISSNVIPPTYFTRGFLGDLVQGANGSVDGIPSTSLAVSPTDGKTYPVSAILELKSTTGALLVPRMTTTQRDQLDNASDLTIPTVSTVANGMIVYDSTLNDFVFYQNGGWATLSSLSGVNGPASSTNTALVRWNGTGGNNLEDSTVLLSNAGALTGPISIQLGTASTTAGTITLLNATNANTLILQPGVTGANITFTLPTAVPTVNNAPLVSSTAGVLSFGNTIDLGTGGSSTGTIIFGNATNANTFTLQSGVSGSNLTFTLPTADGTHANAPLVTNGSGVLSFGTTVSLGTASTTNGIITLLNSTNANTFSIHAGATGSNLTFTLPIADAGVASGPLVSDGAGTLSFGTTIGLGKGSTTDGQIVLYNHVNNNTLTLHAGTTGSNLTFVLPIADATYANAPLVSNASGTLTFNNLAVLSATVTLNQAAIQGAYATPFQLIAAPGAGEAIVILSAQVYTNFQTAAFTGGGVAIVQYDSTIHGAGTNALAATIPAAEITAAASQIYGLAGVTASALTAITNKGIFFSNQTGAFTGGNAASTVVITLQYMVIAATV